MPGEKGDSFRLGMAAFRKKRYEEAVSHFSEAILEHAVVHRSYNALGVTYSILGNTRDAEICFEKAVAIDPDNKTYQKNLNAIFGDDASAADRKKLKRVTVKSFREMNTRIMIGMTLVVVLCISLIGLQSGFDLGSRMDGFFSGTIQDGFLTSWVNSLHEEARILPEPTIRVGDKRIEFYFDQEQDLSNIERIETVLSTTKDSEDHQQKLPAITSPQHRFYYAIDDPFFGKQKHIVMTVYYKDGISAVIANRNLSPR